MPTTGNLLIRADAGPTIGAGHVMRCLALAQQWRAEGGRATFACSELPEVLGDRLRSEGCEVAIIDVAVGSPDDAAATLNLAHDLDAVVVADGYRFSVDYQGALHDNVRALLVLDDYGQIGTYRAGMILDQNLGTTEAIYVGRPPDCRLLLGPEYVMLRREFLDAAEDRREVGPAARDVLVTTGGSDVGGLAGKILKVLDEIPEPLNITLVVGGANSGTGVLEPRARRSHHRVRLIENAANMPELMAEADLAISGAGSTAWELAFMGVPSTFLALATNQQLVARNIVDAGFGILLGHGGEVGEGPMGRGLVSVLADQSERVRMSRAGRRLIDGRGAARVVDAMKRAWV